MIKAVAAAPISVLMLPHDIAPEETKVIAIPQVYGSTPEHFHKADVINTCLTEQGIKAAEAVIIGDTKFDMIGGQKTGVRRLGVTWGFGSAESLQEHGAEIICHQPQDIKKALSSL